MYRYLPRYGKSENENYALNLVNFGAHLSKRLKYDIPLWNSPFIYLNGAMTPWYA